MPDAVPTRERPSLSALDSGHSGIEWRWLSAEMFVVLSLSVAYYFVVSTFAFGNANNYTNSWVFSACSIPGFHLQALYDVWKGRLSGLLISGCLFDSTVHGDSFDGDAFARLFGLYHSVWLFALFTLVILTSRYSLLINFGIFAGLIYNLSPAAGLYFYPWDIPSTVYFTLAVLFFQRRQIRLMIAAVCVGCFFKETVLACALLLLFVDHWGWLKRISVFIGVVAVYLFGKKFLVGLLGITVAPLSMGDAQTWTDLLRPHILAMNLKALFSPTFNLVIFANGGTMVAVLLLGWRKRFLPYMALIVFVIIAQLYYALWSEFRIFMQILPLSLLILSERWLGEGDGTSEGAYAIAPLAPDKQSSQKAAWLGARQWLNELGQSTSVTSTHAAPWATRPTVPALVVVAVTLMIVPTIFAGWRYCVVYDELQASALGLSQIGRHALTPTGEIIKSAVEDRKLRDGYANAEVELAGQFEKDHQILAAEAHYKRALELNPGSVAALNNLAWLQATASDTDCRDGAHAVQLAERACELTGYREPLLVGTLAAAYAEAGKFDQAVTAAETAQSLALAQGQEELAAKNEQMLRLFKSGKVYHQPPTSSR